MQLLHLFWVVEEWVFAILLLIDIDIFKNIKDRVYFQFWDKMT